MSYYDEASLMALQGGAWRTVNPSVPQGGPFRFNMSMPAIGAVLLIAALWPALSLLVGSAFLLAAFAVAGVAVPPTPNRTAWR